MSKITERIEREAGIPGLASLLGERLTPTDLQSLLLEVYRLRSKRRRPADVLSAYESDRFVRPTPASPQRLLAWEQVALASLPDGFEPVELSPVCPLGTVSAVTGLDQDWAVTTARNTEVVSDSTNVLALEAALRRRALLRTDPKSAEPVHLAASHRLLRTDPKSAEPVHLAASHRLLRAQHYDRPDLVAHFALFALCSAGRDSGGLGFELGALSQHIGFYLRALRAFLGPDVPLRLALTDFAGHARDALLEARVMAPARAEHPRLECVFDDARQGGRAYYLDLCFHVCAMSCEGRWLELADGGVVNWTQRLLSNAKERLVTSGIGSERLCSAF